MENVIRPQRDVAGFAFDTECFCVFQTLPAGSDGNGQSGQVIVIEGVEKLFVKLPA
jgi:hypothetical protein